MRVAGVGLPLAPLLRGAFLQPSQVLAIPFVDDGLVMLQDANISGPQPFHPLHVAVGVGEITPLTVPIRGHVLPARHASPVNREVAVMNRVLVLVQEDEDLPRTRLALMLATRPCQGGRAPHFLDCDGRAESPPCPASYVPTWGALTRVCLS